MMFTAVKLKSNREWAAGFLKPEVESKKESPTLGHDQDRPIKPTVDGSRKTRETEDFRK